MPRATKARVLEPHFHNPQVTPLALGRRDFSWDNDFIGLLHRYGVRESLFLCFITRETHQRQLTLGLWPARVAIRFAFFHGNEDRIEVGSVKYAKLFQNIPFSNMFTSRVC